MKSIQRIRIAIQSGVIILLLLGMNLRAQSQNVVPDAVEKNALLSIYYNTNGATWTPAQRWTLSRINSFPDSVLAGVSVVNGDIQSLQLLGIGLNGTLPAEVNNLTELQSLQIINNVALTDTLPYLGGLSKLRSLNLSGNNFQGAIPSWITNLTQLQSLSLSGYSMTGPIPANIDVLTQLNNLSLNYINLSAPGSVPASLMDVNGLQYLSLIGCSLNPASVPSGFTGLPVLFNLNLSSNPSFVMGDGSFPDLLIDLPNLAQLTLQSNNLQKLPHHFEQLNRLNYLDLSGNNFSDPDRLGDVVDTLQLVTSLQTLRLTSCQIGDLPSNMDQLASLQNLYLNNNTLNPTGSTILGSLPAIQNLYIGNNGMTDLPSTLSNLTTLQTLDASNNKLYPVPDVINHIDGLKNLILNSNTIAALPAWFGTGDMHSLLQLSLDNNLLTLPLPDSLAHLKNLTSLSIANNDLEGNLPDYFSGYTKLFYLNLANNGITSPLPDLSALTTLNYIYLQQNKLSGTVPTTLTNNPVPKVYVNLSFNRFDALSPYHSQSNMTLIVNNNKLDFTNILKVTRPIQQYTYIPQDTVISLMGQPSEVKAYVGNALDLSASIDQGLTPASQYQWFKYVDGVHDIPLTSAPSANGNYNDNNFASTDAGKYYYKITNPAVPGLVLISPIVTVVISPCKTDAIMGIGHRQYICAFTFSPPANSINCQGIGYQWNFGDNKTSADKNPVHSYKDPGTYTVSLALTFRCGTACQSDTTIQKQIVYDPANDTDMFKDSVVYIASDIRSQIIATSASTFSDAWPLQHVNADLTSKNYFANGSRGVWRNEGNYVYKTARSQSNTLDLSKDGTFEMEKFNWQQAGMDALPGWIKTNTMTEYSPFSYELENKDVLGVYSAALYDYGGHLPSANGVNMRNNEMAFTSFEYLDGTVSGNWIIGTQSIPAYRIYNVKSGDGNMALVEATLDQVEDAQQVDVTAVRLSGTLFKNPFNYISNDSVVCRQVYAADHHYTAMILKEPPFPGLWAGKVVVRNQLSPIVTPDIDNSVAHSGKSSLRVNAKKTFKQGLLHLDSSRTYLLSAWVSVNNPNVVVPVLANNLGIDVTVKNRKGIVANTFSIQPVGPVIEGWQQVKGTFTCPVNDAQLEISFLPGSTGQAWYDDLRLHPDKGNMKSYVYDLNDYRLMATLDEENFGSFYYYDKEGNLYLVKKETEKGVKTISENVSWMGEK